LVISLQTRALFAFMKISANRFGGDIASVVSGEPAIAIAGPLASGVRV
jgi:hypothetical protein